MTNAEITQLSDQYVMKTYGRLPIAFVKGEGCRLWDADGKEYLDFLAGISVLGTGHCHPKVVAAICEQAGTLMHTSNLFQIESQAK
ncbi:MAG: aminotransferase class III-fold pyridoxal phosphate-dependent enzyme, partial [Armatimonadota bacterium]